MPGFHASGPPNLEGDDGEEREDSLRARLEALGRAGAFGTGVTPPPDHIGGDPLTNQLTIYQGRPAGFDPAGTYSRSWTLDPGFARNYAGPEGTIFTKQVTGATWADMVRRTWLEGAQQAAGLRAMQANLEEGRAPTGPSGQSFAASASPYDPTVQPPARVTAGPAPSAEESLRQSFIRRADAQERARQPWVARAQSIGVGATEQAAGSDFDPGTMGPLEPQARPTMGAVQQAAIRGGAAIALGTGLPQSLPGLPSSHRLLGRSQGGNFIATGYGDPNTGEVSIPGGMLRSATRHMSQAFSGAMEAFGSMKPEDAVRNVNRVMYNAANEWLRGAEEASSKMHAGDPASDTAYRQMAARTGEAVRKMVYSQVDKLEKFFGAGSGTGAVRAQGISMQNFQDMLAGRYGADAATAQQWQQAAAGAVSGVQGGMGTIGQLGVSFTGPGGNVVSLAGSGAGGGSSWIPQGAPGTGGQGPGGGGRRSMWGGNLGGLLYGGYIARRFWSYTGAPVMRAMQGYEDVQAGLEPLITGQIPQGGPAAMSAQRANAQYMLGSAASNIFGRALGLANQAMINVPGLAGGAAGFGVLGGGALAANIVGSQLSGPLRGIGGALSGVVSPALGIAALGVGGLSAAADITSRQYGRNVNIGGAAEEFGRTVFRTGLSFSMLGGAAAAGLTGRSDAYRQRVGAIMSSPFGQWVSELPGEARAGGEMASAYEVAQLAEDLGVGAPQVQGMLAGAIGMTGQQGLGDTNRQLVSTMNRLMQTRGLSESGAASLMGGYAEALGYVPGEADYAQAANMFGNMPLETQSRMMQGAQRRAGMGSQFRQILSRDFISTPALNQLMGMFDTQQAGQVTFGGLNQLISAGMGEEAAVGLAARLNQRVSGVTPAGTRYSTLNLQTMQTAMSMGAQYQYETGAGDMQTIGMINNLSGMTSDQLGLTQRMWRGDMGAMSYLANAGQIDPGMALQDVAGRSLYQTNMLQGIQNLGQAAQYFAGGSMVGQQVMGMPAYQNIQQINQLMTMNQGRMGLGSAMQNVLGISGTMASFFDENPEAGLRDYQLEHSRRMYGFQQAGIGIGLQRIALQRDYLWGGGDWRNPSRDSMWGIQDRMRALQWQGQQAAFQFSLESMDVSNQFGMRQEDITGRRMDLTQGYQRWQMGFQRAGMDLSRQFTLENRQFSDQLRGLQVGWQLEDFDEAIRMSSGRQRRQLVRQRERFVTTTNIEDERTERQREQQEELWAREDEQFEKRREYTESLMALDQEQYNLNVERRETLYEMNREDLERRIELAEELHELQNEQIEKQREHQVKMLELQEQSLGIQAAAAAAQQEYNEDMLKTEDTLTVIEKIIESIAKNEPSLNKMIEMAETIGSTETGHVVKAMDMINNVRTGKLIGAIRAIQDMQGLP